MSQISTPLELPCGVTLPNRICKAAMTEGLAEATGAANEKLERLYETWSKGGAGLLITGNVMIDGQFLERSGNVTMDAPRALVALTRWAKAGTSGGNQFWVQLNHPGRQCSRFISGEPVSPSDVQLKLGNLYARPRQLKEIEIEQIIAQFAQSAKLVQDAGFTGVQIHSAHGYLGSQFLSPLTNKRHDRWGGPLEHRARFLLSTIRAVREAVGPSFPVAVKLNSSDFQKGAFSMEDSLQVARWVSEQSVDLLEISGGTYEALEFLQNRKESTRKREAFFLDYAKELQGKIKIPLMITGGFRTRAAMDDALQAGDCQVIGIARPFCIDPDFPRKMKDEAIAKIPAVEEELHSKVSSISRFFRSLTSQAQAAWYYQQILYLAENRSPKLDLNMWLALTRFYIRDFGMAMKRRTILKRSAPRKKG